MEALPIVTLAPGRPHLHLPGAELVADSCAGDADAIASAMDAAPGAGARWLLISGVTQALSADGRETTREAVRMARRNGTLVAYDPGYRPQLWHARGGLDAARRAFAEVAGDVDWLLPSFPADAALLADGFDGNDVVATMRAFARRSGHVALKCGAAGAWLAYKGWFFDVPAEPAVDAIDTAAARDAWNSTFLRHLIDGVAPAQAARAAHHAAAGRPAPKA